MCFFLLLEHNQNNTDDIEEEETGMPCMPKSYTLTKGRCDMR